MLLLGIIGSPLNPASFIESSFNLPSKNLILESSATRVVHALPYLSAPFIHLIHRGDVHLLYL